MMIKLEHDVSPVTGIGWKASCNGDSSFGRTRDEAVWPVAHRQLRPGESASVVLDNQAVMIVTRQQSTTERG